MANTASTQHDFASLRLFLQFRFGQAIADRQDTFTSAFGTMGGCGVFGHAQSLMVERLTCLGGGYYQLKEDPILNTQFVWRESISLSGITLYAPHVQSAKSGLS